ncbi:hypothetical protein SLEP1_g56795 [Rubroshorea leprosula]|uniref:Integrase catalytic domain-containing protein n=1 Tax=Rubroshorea leprosula TaxID=152421 RepID=A0AAV5MJC0_9ROSI|nr:hypothetical protein SLEP1_g56795 [Rubroshorea leprosula]
MANNRRTHYGARSTTTPSSFSRNSTRQVQRSGPSRHGNTVEDQIQHLTQNMEQMERSVHAIEQAVTLLIENHGQLHLPPVRAHRARVPPRREGSNVETQENDPNYVPSQRSTSADNINTLEPTSAFQSHIGTFVLAGWYMYHTPGLEALRVQTLRSQQVESKPSITLGSVPFYTEESSSNLVDNLDEGVAMHALMNGLKDCDFLHSLNREEPKSFKDILHRSEGYIRAEERAVAKKGVAKETEHLNWLEKLRSNGNKRDKTRHCAFHGTHDHDTEDFPPSATLTSMALAVKGRNESQPSTQTITFTAKDLDQREGVAEMPFWKSVLVRGIISLPIHLGVSTCVAVVTLDFFVIDVPSSFNAILGCLGLNSLQVVVSTQAMMIKFPTPHGVGMARGKPVEVVERTQQAQDQVQTSEPNKVTKKKYKSKHWDLVALGDIVKEKTLIVDSPYMRPERTVNIGVDMDPSFMARLENCLREHKDIFAWCPADMLGIDPKVACHRLGVNPVAVPVRQKVRHFGAERTAAIEEEVAKLKEAGFIQEITFSEWLSNVVMVKKANGKWRMCVDFTDLNKVCPKDNYPLPNIDELVDNSFGYVVFSLCDAYSGYNQIPMAKEDRDKTTFIAAGATCCYVVMPFGLKNAGATYQRGIEVNPEKIRAVLEMKPPSSIKEVHKLMGKVVALSRAIPGEKLYLYIAASTEAISAALVREDGSKQEPVYYVSKVLQGVETRHKPLEKLAYAKPDLAGRLVRWSIELTQFELEFQPRRVMKAQVLADFIAELSKEEKAVMQAPPIDVPCKKKAPKPKKPTKNLPSNLVWNLYADGSSNAAGSGAGIILISPKGETFECALKFNFEASNNRAEYEALLGGLRLAKAAGVEYLRIYSDSQLIGYELSQVRRSENLKVDALAKLASTGLGVSGVEVYIETLSSPSIEMENASPTQEEQNWIDPILTFLKSGILPEDEKEAKRLRRKAAWYTIFDGFAHVQHQPANPLHMIVAPWPFAQWGMDILGPFPKAKGRKKFLIVAIDYFTKWIEAEPVAQITEQKVEEFVKKHIMCRFGMLRVLVTDNGMQFASEAFKDFCQTGKIERRFLVRAQLETEGLSLQQIEQRFASVAYPESNGQAEAANKAILESLKKKNLDLLDEARDLSQIHVAHYHRRVEKYYNSKVRPKDLHQGDWVLRKAEVTECNSREGKLRPSWEGPYLIQKDLGNGAFKLVKSSGTPIPRAWNAVHLKKYYQ